MNQLRPSRVLGQEMVESIELLHVLGSKYSTRYEKLTRNELIKEMLLKDKAIEELKERIHTAV